MDFVSFVDANLGSLIIASVLTFTLVLNILAYRSNKKAIEMRERPWISAHRPPNRDSAIEFNEKMMSIHFKNTGPIPAFDVTYSYYYGKENPEKNEVNLKPGNEVPMDIGTNEAYTFYINLEPGFIVIDEEKNQKGDFYYLINIEYKDLNKKPRYHKYWGHYLDGRRFDDKSRVN